MHPVKKPVKKKVEQRKPNWAIAAGLSHSGRSVELDILPISRHDTREIRDIRYITELH
jgi:hypothetical protein